MKIFYGVQGTGNGHITRARALAPKFKAAGADVTWLFSGRPRDAYFEMEVFGDYQSRAGLTFQAAHGNVHYIRTTLRNNLVKFVNDIRSLAWRGFDLVITDFEPVTAWAAWRQGFLTVGIGHQFAFG
ncbi:MAG: glycosyltransferase, partial [Methylococcaceae bacterium]|nr:glycosyltransferase [Methylococcaceae bacterium]